MKIYDPTEMHVTEGILAILLLTGMTACSSGKPTVTDTSASYAMQPIGGIKDLMEYEIDPSADAIWDSVSTVGDATGIHDKAPSNDKEWAQIRGQAVVLAEAANLLQLSGRKVTVAGQRIQDDGARGILTTEQAEQAIQANRAAFLGFAKALQQIAGEIITATEAKDSQAILVKGEALDELCESCHLQFWYPKSAAATAH